MTLYYLLQYYAISSVLILLLTSEFVGLYFDPQIVCLALFFLFLDVVILFWVTLFRFNRCHCTIFSISRLCFPGRWVPGDKIWELWMSGGVQNTLFTDVVLSLHLKLEQFLRHGTVFKYVTIFKTCKKSVGMEWLLIKRIREFSYKILYFLVLPWYFLSVVEYFVLHAKKKKIMGTKRCSASLIRGMQIKPQWDTTSQLLGWLLSKKQKVTSASKDVEKL